MALLFSAVRATANDQEVEFFVGGIPREYDDLEGWTAFDRFMGEIDKETEVAVHAESYLYGEDRGSRIFYETNRNGRYIPVPMRQY